MAKRRSYLGKIISETWKETEWGPVIIEDMIAGIVIAVLAAMLKICQWDEFKELAFLIIGTALCGFFLGFIYRLFISAAKLYKEQERKIRSLESKLEERGDKNPNGTLDTENRPIQQTSLATTILICLSAGLATLLIAQNIKIKNLLNPPMQVAAAKPKPKIIFEPETNKPDQASRSSQIETQEQIDVFSHESNGTPSFFEKLKQEHNEQKQQRIDAINSNWKVSVEPYRHLLTTLNNLMFEEAGKHGDDIAELASYPNCLPSLIDPDIGDHQVTYVKFQKDTNWVFTISLYPYDDWRILRINCAAGWLDIRGSVGEFHRWFQFNDPDFGNFHLEKSVPVEQAKDLIDESVEILIGAETNFLSKTK